MMFLASNNLHNLRGQKMIMPMLSGKTFATNSLKLNFLLDVWFECDAGYDNIQSTRNDSNSSINICFLPSLGVKLSVFCMLLFAKTAHKLVKPVMKSRQGMLRSNLLS